MHLFTAQVKLCILITISDSVEILGNEAQKFKKKKTLFLHVILRLIVTLFIVVSHGYHIASKW